MADRKTGNVTRIMHDKGFGFIRESNGAQEYFFHRSGVIDGDFSDLIEKDPVSFDVASSPKGPRAEGVRKEVRSS